MTASVFTVVNLEPAGAYYLCLPVPSNSVTTQAGGSRVAYGHAILYEVIDKLHFAQARMLWRGNRNQFAFCTAPFASWSLRSSRQRLYCSAFAGSGSSSRFNQKQYQSTALCSERYFCCGFTRSVTPSG